MNKNTVIVPALLAVIAGSYWAGHAAAADSKPAGLSAQTTTWTALKTAQANDSKINLILENGAMYLARIKDLGTNAVVLKEPAGKEFYEVFIPLDKIAAIELKVR